MRNHEVNVIADLVVLAVDIVQIRYTLKPNQRRFTALITASAKDYYLDDRDNRFLRGDSAPAQFQEFWTFWLQDGEWRLSDIEQSGESDALKEEDLFEQFTDAQVERLTGGAPAETGPAGPWLAAELAAKAARIERLLNFLGRTDKLWSRQLMLDRASEVFTDVYMALEARLLPAAVEQKLFPQTAALLHGEIQRWKESGVALELRNFCVRKVELVLINNFADNSRDEFVVRISAHAQRKMTAGGNVMRSDQYVEPFADYWTFGRLNSSWKLKELVPADRGNRLEDQENLDEDSNLAQLRWYYTKRRAT